MVLILIFLLAGPAAAQNNIIVGDTFVLTGEARANIQVSIFLDGRLYETAADNNGKYSHTFSGLSAGRHDIRVEGFSEGLNQPIELSNFSIEVVIARPLAAQPVEGFLERVFYPVAIGISVVGVGVGVAVSFGQFVSQIKTFDDLRLAAFRIFAVILELLRLKRKARPWGVVYDAVTKEPLDPAIVSLHDREGKEIDTHITDLDGRYGFLVEPGYYRLEAKKTNYSFPSQKITAEKDELYDNVYRGGFLEVSDPEVIRVNIPMDPLKFDWNQFAKGPMTHFKPKKELVRSRLTSTFFWGGFAFSILALPVRPGVFNIGIVILYILLLILRKTGFRSRSYGHIFLRASGEALPFAIVRAFYSGTQNEAAAAASDKNGRYYLLVPPGEYYLKVEKKNPDGSYSLARTSEPFSAKGVANFNIGV